MPISQTDQLFQLIKSLSKAEKRNFTVYANRIQDSDNLKYVQLFELMDKQKELNEPLIFSKLKDTDKSQYSNLKRHLYKQIMISLRLIYIQKKADIEIREYLDFVDILYSKGLYLQSLKLLEKAKALALKSNNDILFLSLLETEKTIESRHITRSGPDTTENLTALALKTSQEILNSTKLSNLRLLLHAFYIKFGHVKNAEEHERINAFFEDNLPKLDIKKLNFPEQVYLYQSLVWYYYISLDFENCYVYADKWIKAFKSAPQMIEEDPDLFMRGFHYLLTCSFNLGETEKFIVRLDELEKFRKANYKKFSPNSQIISFMYVHHGRLNKFFIQKKYKEGIAAIPGTLRRINRYRSKLDSHRIMVFYFKFAWMHLMAKDPGKAIDYLNEIQKMEMGALRQDIQVYTRIMFMMAHYDMGNIDIMEYLANNTKIIASKLHDGNALQHKAISFFSKLVRTPIGDRRQEFRKFLEEVQNLKYDPYEKRAFIYLDLEEWIQSKI